MPKTVKYIGTVTRWPELATTGKQSTWVPGQQEQRSDTEAAQLLATGLFSDVDATQLPEQKVVAISGVVSGAGVVVSGNVTINASNAATYHNADLLFSGAYTVTLAAGITAVYPGFKFSARPPDSGNASIAASSVTLNGAGTTITRALASQRRFAVIADGTDAYSVTGE